MLFSEPKIPQFNRAEPSVDFRREFQCSSASRKFLNDNYPNIVVIRSAKFQCSSASRKFLNGHPAAINVTRATFQCSSASRKFLNAAPVCRLRALDGVSVLFSEPKIPQSAAQRSGAPARRFQCSSASRKFLNPRLEEAFRHAIAFQCSSASRKFLNPTLAPASIHIPDCDDHASSFLSLPGASP